MKVKIIDIDKPNANGRIYPREVVEKAFKKYKEDMVDKNRAIVFNTNSSTRDNDLANAYGVVKDIIIEGDEGFVEMEPLSLVRCSTFTALLEDNKLFVATAGVASLKDGVVQDDYELTHLFLTDDPSYIKK